jgi:hypothetical protein
MDDDDEKTALQLAQELLDDFDGFIEEIETKSTAYDQHMEYLKSGAMPRLVDMDTPVKVEDAIFLPELGGAWTVNPELSIPSQTHAVKTIRSAIASGALAFEQPNRKQFVTRRFVQEWRESCRDQSSPQDSYSEKKPATPQAKLPTKRSGESMTEERKLRQASAKAILNSLKKP